MGYGKAELEGLANQLYERVGLDPAVPVDTFRLARKLLGPQAIERGVGLVGMPARLFTVHGTRRIAICRKLPFAQAQFWVGHELAHILIGDYREPDLEQLCDYLAAALMAPREAMRSLLRAFGPDHRQIAAEVCATQTWAALRIAECTGAPRAVVTPARCYVRCPDDYVLPAEPHLRRLTTGSRPGIKKSRLTDAAGRTVLDFEEVA
jgi:hypothetical protein